MLRLMTAVLLLACAACETAPVTETHTHGPVTPPQPGKGLVIKGVDGRTVEVSAAEFAAMPRTTIKVVFHDEPHTFEGVPLTALLDKVGAPTGDRLRGQQLALVVLATARDGYRVAYSLSETDAVIRSNRVIIADKDNGQPLPDSDGPWRIVAEGDLKPARSARMIASIEVRKLD